MDLFLCGCWPSEADSNGDITCQVSFHINHRIFPQIPLYLFEEVALFPSHMFLEIHIDFPHKELLWNSNSVLEPILADQLPAPAKIWRCMWNSRGGHSFHACFDIFCEVLCNTESRFKKWLGCFFRKKLIWRSIFPNLIWSKYGFASFDWAFCMFLLCLDIHQANQPQPKQHLGHPQNLDGFFSTITCRCFKWWWKVMVNKFYPLVFQWYFLLATAITSPFNPTSQQRLTWNL